MLENTGSEKEAWKAGGIPMHACRLKYASPPGRSGNPNMVAFSSLHPSRRRSVNTARSWRDGVSICFANFYHQHLQSRLDDLAVTTTCFSTIGAVVFAKGGTTWQRRALGLR